MAWWNTSQKKAKKWFKETVFKRLFLFLVMVREGTIGGTGPEADDMGDGAEGELSG